MPVSQFGSKSEYVEKNDTSSFVHKSFLRIHYNESKTEKLIDMKNQIFLKNLLRLFPQEAASKNYVDTNFSDRNITKYTSNVNFNNKTIDKVWFFRITPCPAAGVHPTAKYYVHKAVSNPVGKSSLITLDPSEKMKRNEQDSAFLNSTLISPKTKIDIPSKAHVDSLSEIDRIKRDISTVSFDQNKEFDIKKLTSLDSNTAIECSLLDEALKKQFWWWIWQKYKSEF